MQVTGLIVGSYRVTVTILTTVKAENIEVTVFALITVNANYVSFALARTRALITYRFTKKIVGAGRKALAFLAIAFGQYQSITIVTWKTNFTSGSSSIMDTP